MNIQTNLVRTPGHAVAFIEYFKLSGDQSVRLAQYSTTLHRITKVALCCLRACIVSVVLPVEFVAVSLQALKASLDGAPADFVLKCSALRMFRGVASSADSFVLMAAFIFRAELIHLVVNVRHFREVLAEQLLNVTQNIVVMLGNFCITVFRINQYVAAAAFILLTGVFLIAFYIALGMATACILLVSGLLPFLAWTVALRLQIRTNNPQAIPDIHTFRDNFNRFLPTHLRLTDHEDTEVRWLHGTISPEYYHTTITPLLKKIGRIIKHQERTNIAQRNSILSKVLGYHFENSLVWNAYQNRATQKKNVIRNLPRNNGKVVDKRFWDLLDQCKDQMRVLKQSRNGLKDNKSIAIYTTVKRMIKEGICTPQELCQAATTSENQFLENAKGLLQAKNLPNAAVIFELLKEARKMV